MNPLIILLLGFIGANAHSLGQNEIPESVAALGIPLSELTVANFTDTSPRAPRVLCAVGSHPERDAKSAQAKNGVRGDQYKWYKYNSNYILPAYLDTSYSESDRQKIFKGMTHIQDNTCIRFWIYSDENQLKGYDYVFVKNEADGYGCYSWAGRQRTGKQDVILPVGGCLEQGSVVHEFVHAIGFHHEHQRPERDDWINIYWDNVIERFKYAFDKFSSNDVDGYGAPYDYASVMHYPKWAFTKNGQDTMRPKQSTSVVIGEASGLSQWDIHKIQKMYGCA